MYRIQSNSDDPQFQKVLLTGSATYQRFGWALTVLDLNQDGVDDLVVSQAFVGKALVMRRFHARARGRAGRVEKPFSNLTIIVREVPASAEA